MPSPLAMSLLQAQAAAGVPQPYTASVQPTNITGATNDYNNAMEQQYAAKLGQQNAMWGGLAGLGSAGLLVAPKLFGSTGAGAAGGASLFGNASGGTAAAPLAGLDASDYGAGSSLLDQFGLGSGSIAATDAAAGAGAADAGATAAASPDILASLLALFA
jgi:hypothetical protein